MGITSGLLGRSKKGQEFMLSALKGSIPVSYCYDYSGHHRLQDTCLAGRQPSGQYVL